MQTINLGAADELPPVDWDRITATLDARDAPGRDDHNARTTWLTTLNEDGSPHVTPVGALWLDGGFWFQTGAPTRKHANVERDPRCAVAVSVLGADVVVEGRAERVTGADDLDRAAAAWAQDGWPAQPDPGGAGITAPFNAPAQGPPPWHVYRVVPSSAVVVLGTDPGGLTRFRF